MRSGRCVLHLRCRSLAFVILSLSFALLLYPQEKSAPAKEENLYFKALQASLVEMNKEWGYIDDSDGGSQVRTDYHHMKVLAVPGITDDLPEQFGEYRMEYMDDQKLIAKCNELRKEFSVLKIWPMKSEGPNLKISVSVYWVSYKHKKLMFGVSDWSEVEFRFDCQNQSYVVANVKLGGI